MCPGSGTGMGTGRGQWDQEKQISPNSGLSGLRSQELTARSPGRRREIRDQRLERRAVACCLLVVILLPRPWMVFVTIGECIFNIPGLLVVVSLLVEPVRTAVAFFNTNLLLAVALGLLGARREVAADRDRSVLSFRSGLGLLGLLGFELLVSLGGLGLALLVGGGEDAEGDGDASLKVQIGDL